MRVRSGRVLDPLDLANHLMSAPLLPFTEETDETVDPPSVALPLAREQYVHDLHVEDALFSGS